MIIRHPAGRSYREIVDDMIIETMPFDVGQIPSLEKDIVYSERTETERAGALNCLLTRALTVVRVPSRFKLATEYLKSALLEELSNEFPTGELAQEVISHFEQRCRDYAALIEIEEAQLSDAICAIGMVENLCGTSIRPELQRIAADAYCQMIVEFQSEIVSQERDALIDWHIRR